MIITINSSLNFEIIVLQRRIYDIFCPKKWFDQLSQQNGDKLKN